MGRVGGAAGGTGDLGGTRTMMNTKKQKPPAQSGPIFLYYTDLVEEDVVRLRGLETKQEVRDLLKQCMNIDQSEGFKTEILCDMHYHNYSFCVSRNFSAEKISTFLSIMKRVLQEAVEKKLPYDESFDVFKSWLLKHSVERPPWSVGIFAFDDVQAITEYVHATFYRHYKLYMYTYMTRCDIDFRVDRRCGAGFPTARRALPLNAPCQVDIKSMMREGATDTGKRPIKNLCEFASLFKPSERELAEQALRQLHEPPPKPEDRSTLIKRKVEEGVKDLLEDFEQKLKEQDERFEKLRAEAA